MNCFILVTFFLSFRIISSSLTTEYYEKLINDNIEEATHYKLPQNNAEFKQGVGSDCIHNAGTYDFIIVGAGSSGAVLATRLSEIHKWNILLLEAGDEENDFSKIPSMLNYLQFSKKNWGYLSIPQKKCCLGMKNHRCMVPTGKSMGGTSPINALMYVRGNAKDFDRWAQIGNPGWSYKEVLPYFIKSENSQIDDNCGYHGKGGLWNLQYSLPPSDIFSNFLGGNKEMDQKIVDYNGFQQIGVSKSQVNVKFGKRQSSSTAFLENARQRANLKIITKALVTKIIIDTKIRSAKGVLFVKGNAKFLVRAKKEVIVSGGAYNSPQLLMLSGIGPRIHLEELGIETIEDLPVGKNLLDHPYFQGMVFRTNYTYTGDMKEAIEQYLKGLGTLTRPTNADGLGFIHTGDLPPGVPMLEYILLPPNSNNPIMNKLSNFNNEVIQNYLSNLQATTDIGFDLVLFQVKSRGRVTLKSKNPLDFPNIDLNMFDHPEDIDNMIKGIEFLLQLSKTKAFRKLNARLVDIPICQRFTKHSRMFWECVLRHITGSGYHPSGTTAMGPNRRNSVVNHELRVHGIGNLRVVDAGVFPTTLSGHPNAACVMIAEKIADVIKVEYAARLC